MSSTLTARQEECLRLTRLMTDKEIAAHLGISEPTVKKHVLEACQRLGVNRRKAALALLEQSSPENLSQARLDTVEPPATEQGSERGRWGYRGPPRSPLFRIVMIGVLALLLAVMVRAMTDLVFGYHQKVGEVDRALTGSDRIAIPPVRP